MKRFFSSKLLNVLIIVSLILFFSVPGNVYSRSLGPVTNVNVSVYPSSPSVAATYTITFTYDEALACTIIISGLRVTSAPLSGSISSVTLNGSSVSANCKTNDTTATITLSYVNVKRGGNTIVIPSSAGIVNPGSGTYQIYLTVNGNTVLSQPYTIGASQVSNVQVSVSPPLKGANAEYQVSFKTSPNGLLTANTNKIYIQFPLGTGLPASIPGNYITVNNIPCNGTITVDTINRTIGIPLPLNIYPNTDVAVVISEQAAITNPSGTGSYYLILWTTTDSEHINSPVYTISSSSITQLTVLPPSPSTVGANAKYVIQFKTSTSGALTANVDTISVSFPPSTYVPTTNLQASYISINNQNCTYVSAFGTTLTIKTPVSIGNSSSVKVTIDESFGIKNPTQTGDYKISVSTSKDLNPVNSPEYTISATTLSKAFVVVSPAIIGESAQYVIQFNVGSGGALSGGDTIKVVFPEGTFIPSSIPISLISVNGYIPSSITSSSLLRSITVTLPQNFSVSGGGAVAISISKTVGIKNPNSPSNSYYLKISTSKESTLIQSNTFKIYGAPAVQLIVTPSSPDGNNGYYISTPHVELKLDNPAGVVANIYYHIDQNPDQIYDAPFAIQDGVHSVYYHAVITSSGISGQEGTKQFKVDTISPDLSITEPKNNESVYQNTVLIKGITEKGATLTINGRVVPVDEKGIFSSTVVASEGVNTVDVVALDQAGNHTEKKVNFTYISRVIIILQVGNSKAYVNNKEVSLDAAPFIYKNRVMVPFRFLAESLHAVPQWDPIFKIVTLTIGNLRIRVQVGNSTADVGGKPVLLDTAPIIVDGRTFVPLRFFAENFGASVDWNDEMKIVNITYPKP